MTVLFFKTAPPIVPTDLAHAVCLDALNNKPRTRFIKRLTPVTLVGKASEAALEELMVTVLKPYFHSGTQRSYAIRPTLRHHNKPLTRDGIIKQVARAVGEEHKVNLDNPELVVLVDVYKNICGAAVVPGDYEKGLKKYNLAELYRSRNRGGATGGDAVTADPETPENAKEADETDAV